MKVAVVDPPAYTPPYDHALCTALGRRGIDVELATSRFRHGPLPRAEGYARRICFYRWGAGSARAKGAQHPLDMLKMARRVRSEGHDVVHFQWLPIPRLDQHLIRRFPNPRVVTAHDVLPREAGRTRRRAAAALLQQADAVVAHSEHGRDRLVREAGVEPAKVRVIPHGAFDYLTRLPEEIPIDPAAGVLDGRKVVLSFGLIRPYKGIEVLLEAFALAPDDAVLLIVGRPMMPTEPLRRRASELGLAERVRLVPRFVSEPEVPAYFRRADLVVLPYREAEQSGVLCTALAFGAPLVVTAVGGFVELGERYGAARLVAPGDPESLGRTLAELLADDRARDELSRAARRAAAGPLSWDRAAELTADLYRSLVDRSA